MLADAHYRVHVVGVDNGCRTILLGDGVNKFVNHQRGLGVQSGVRLVAEEILGLQGDGTSYGHALLHTSRNFTREFVTGFGEIDAVEAVFSTTSALFVTFVRKHVERKHYIFFHRQAVKERRILEYHSHLATEHHAFAFFHAHKVASIIKDLSRRGRKESHDALHQHCFSGTGLTNDEIGLAGFEGRVDVFEHLFVFE